MNQSDQTFLQSQVYKGRFDATLAFIKKILNLFKSE
jgi:hypothetical protein